MREVIFVLLLLFSLQGNTCANDKFVSLNLSDKSVSLYPFYKVFGSHLDPAISLGGGIGYFKKNGSLIFQNADVTGYSHPMIGTGLTVSTSLGYSYDLFKGIYVETMLGLAATGYFAGRETFSLNENNDYEEDMSLRMTFGIPMDLSFGYKTSCYAFYWKYRYQVEGKYAAQIPLLSTSLISIGIKYWFSKSKN